MLKIYYLGIVEETRKTQMNKKERCPCKDCPKLGSFHDCPGQNEFCFKYWKWNKTNNTEKVNDKLH